MSGVADAAVWNVGEAMKDASEWRRAVQSQTVGAYGAQVRKELQNLERGSASF
jgi:hypothetical protein